MVSISYIMARRDVAGLYTRGRGSTVCWRWLYLVWSGTRYSPSHL